MSLLIQIALGADVAPILRQLSDALEDGTELHRYVAGEAERMTRDHILEASLTRHKTAERLGAQPTGYLERAAEGVSSRAETDAAVIVLGGDNQIFKRAFGPVEVRPRTRKFLTIPAKAAAYGKRAREFDLELIVFKAEDSDAARLALGKRNGDEVDVYYWLVRKATLPEDRGLLPTDDQFAAAAEMGAVAYLDALPQ